MRTGAVERTHPVRTGAVAGPSGAHRVQPVRTTMRTTVHPVRSTRWAVRAPVRSARGSGAHRVDGGAVKWARVETVKAVRFSLT